MFLRQYGSRCCCGVQGGADMQGHNTVHLIISKIKAAQACDTMIISQWNTIKMVAKMIPLDPSCLSTSQPRNLQQ